MLFYNLVQKSNPIRPDEPKKLYVSLKTLGLVRVDEVTKRITEKINIQEDLCRSVLNTWNKVAIELLTTGHSVELGDAGYVYLRASSNGADTEEEATANMVKNVKGRMRFNKKVLEKLNSTSLINVRDMTSGINVRTQPENPQQTEE